MVFADIKEIHRTSWPFAIPDIPEIGLTDKLGTSGSDADEQILRTAHLVFSGQGKSTLSPDAWVNDQAGLDRPGNAELQLEYLRNY